MISFIWFLFFLIFGACIGSFLTMLTHRLPNKEDLIFKNSYCPKCGAKLKARSLIPILSYFLQRGKCLNCNKKISVRYPIIEITNTLAYISLFLVFGSTFTTFFLCLLFSLLLAIVIIDLERMEVPVYLQAILLFFAVIYILLNYEIDPLFSLISACIYFIAAELARILVEKFKKDANVLGGGDTKLITLAGLFLGVTNLGIFFLLCGVLGAIFGFIWIRIKKEKIFPFAPAIVISLFFLIVLKYFW